MTQNNNNRQNRDPMTNIRTMANEGMKIIRDIAFGRYDIYGDPRSAYFRNLVFTNAVISEVNKKLSSANIIYNALIYTYGSENPNAEVIRVIADARKTLEAYNIVYNALSNIVLSNGNVGYLYIMQNRLPAYKHNLWEV